MPRISVVTGAASGIGIATKELLKEPGKRVIGVDLHDAGVVVDSGPPRAGRLWARACTGSPAERSMPRGAPAGPTLSG